MLGLWWMRAKTFTVIDKVYGYKPEQDVRLNPVFAPLVREVRAKGGNEYDAAIMFMAVQINIVARMDEPDARMLDFATTRLAQSWKLLSKGALRIEVGEWLSEATHNLEPKIFGT